MNFLSGWGAEELTVYGWNTKVSAPFVDFREGSIIIYKLVNIAI